MILNEITLENFRQFRGTQQMSFASGPEGNVTVVFGENGRGKTGVFRALMFCLYGERLLAQDQGTGRDELYLVNTAATREAAANKRPVLASVSVVLTHEGRRYEISRSVRAVRDGDVQHEQLDQVLLTYQDEVGNTKTERDPSVISHAVDRILDAGVKEYFLFDGERIEHLTRAGAQQRKEVARGIRSLLQIDGLEKAVKALGTLSRQLNSELQEVSTGEYAQVLESERQITQSIAQLTDRMRENEDSLALAESELAHWSSKQAADSEIAAQVAERDRLKDEGKSLAEEKQDLLRQMGERVSTSAFLLAEPMVDEIYLDLDGRRQRGEVPSQIRRDLIEQILDDQECICRRSVKPGTDEFNAIVDWKNQAVDEVTENSAMNLWRLLGSLRDRSDDTRAFLETSIQTYADRRQAYEQRVAAHDAITEKIGEDARDDRAEVERNRQQADRRIGQLHEQAKGFTGELEALRSEERNLRAKRAELEQTEGLKGELQERAKLAVAAERALDGIKQSFIDDMREQLSLEASSVFATLLDEEGRLMLKGITVQEDYTLQVVDTFGKPFLANISAGQGQMASLALIMALAKVAAAGGTLEMPLFMDTPFGKLSWKHRRNLIDRIPQLSSQWVLLATDTELGRREAERLLSGHAWGRFYQLVPQADGSSKIIERRVEEARLYLELEEATA